MHADIAGTWIPDALATMARGDAEIRGCERTRALFADAKPATEEDYDTEYLAPIISVRVVTRSTTPSAISSAIPPTTPR